MILCDWCYEETESARNYPIGRTDGPNNDPAALITLCDSCATELESGDLGAFEDRYQSSVDITRPKGPQQ